MRAPSALLAAALCMAAASSAHLSAPVSIPASDARIRWVGRRVLAPSGGYTVDWEGTQAMFTVTNATTIAVKISDTTGSGARIGVWVQNAGSASSSSSSLTPRDPNPSGDEVPNFRVATLITGPGAGLTYQLGSRAAIAGETQTWTLVVLTEPSFIKDSAPDSILTIDAVVTDGRLLPAPQPSARRIEFLGDSLTAGYGAGFDAPVNASSGGYLSCGAGELINDVSMTYGALLCANFSADCNWEAVSGVTLMAGNPNLPMYWAVELGGMLEWKSGVLPFNATLDATPQAVVVNLGENDWNANCGSTPACIAKFTAAYVAFVEHLSAAYGDAAAKSIRFFATIGPHEKGQSVGILPAVAQLQGLGYKASFLNATVDSSLYPPGCGGHPGPSIHRASFEAAQPVIAAAMGW
jgi:hypothetical protein